MTTNTRFDSVVNQIITACPWLSVDEAKKRASDGFEQYDAMSQPERINTLYDMHVKLHCMWDEERDVRDAMYDRIDWMEMFCSQDEVQRARAQYGRMAEKLDADIRWMLDPQSDFNDIPF
jgi:hypothetical protein